MRTILALAAGASLALTIAATGAAQAQTASPQAPSAAQPPAASSAPASPAPSSATPSIKQINVVDIKELPEATQTKVNAVVQQGSEADLQQMRSSLDSNAQIKSALQAKGVSSAQVVLASMDADGTLTLVTKKAS